MVLLDSIVVKSEQKWWNSNTRLNPLRPSPPAEGSVVRYYDLNSDGKPDVLQTVTAEGTPVQWIDDNGNMKIGDISGDMVDDCLMVDRNRDGLYGHANDLVIDWVDTDGDGKADLQTVCEYMAAKVKGNWKGHYMIFLDTDKDNIFNYIDYNTFYLKCWRHEGFADFYADYNGNSTFLKIHASPDRLNDIRLNWENPFLFVDSDKDGLTEMTVRLCDKDGTIAGKFQPKGIMDYAYISVDMDNDNTPENPLDLDMTIQFISEKGTSYMKYSHIYKRMRGLPEADFLFMNSNFRQNCELIFPHEQECFSFIFKDATWDEVNFVFDEDGDCKRWERVEMYEARDLYTIGQKAGGLDNHRQSDAIGDRGEWDKDNSGNGNLYISPMDGKLHLYGAEWGAWRIDQGAQSYQGMGGIYGIYGPDRTQRTFENPPVIRYEDTDGNGFFDMIQYDWKGEGCFTETVSLKELGLSDQAKIFDVSVMDVKDYNRIYKKMAGQMWAQAEAVMKAAEKLGIETDWYALYKSPKSLRQKYEYGYWLQLYLYHDIVELCTRNGDSAMKTAAAKAFYSQSWENFKVSSK